MSDATHAELARFFDRLLANFAEPQPRNTVQPHELLALHSEGPTEDGECILRLYDLRDGRTGAQVLRAGKPGPVFRVD